MKVTVTGRDGVPRELDVEPGITLMEAARDAGLPVKAECGGNCICSTCHVYVDGDWLDRLPPRSDNENDTLDEACEPGASSRLACQIPLTEDLAGLRVTLAPDWS
jgi:2Fe-2S ferredoxin